MFRCEFLSHWNPSGKESPVKGKSEVRILSDSSECYIRHCCALPDGQVLVADNINNKVKLLDQQCQMISHWDVGVVQGAYVGLHSMRL
ncbi:hypothetical protein DPMN_153751 [Dreissena polymorpha]|uniref:Uncharacterized protein n=1 Tax=Dreissena polymorpha TaxID=45954 RepID=A0A9D4FJ62_DREPO|nr:hypothetical protein DPMN_153751 [Dreissena polymorpha]